MGILNDLFGLAPKTDWAELYKMGAQIIDVRTRGEFSSGHINGSVNIPLNELTGKLPKIKKNKPVITVCASGMRSASAKSILKKQGYDAHNGGGWMSLSRKIAK